MNDNFFNPYTFDYKQYIKETYDLNESPQRLNNLHFVFDDNILNHQEGIRIENNTQFIENFKSGEQIYRLFFEAESDNKTYYLLYLDKPLVVAEYSFVDIHSPIKGIENKSVWNHRWFKGLVRYFVENYILLKYKIMVSDYSFTDKGFRFWQTLFDDMVITKKSHKLYIIDFKSGKIIKNITDKNEMGEYFDINMTKYRFVLSKDDL